MRLSLRRDPSRPLFARATLWRLLLLVPVGGAAWLLGQGPTPNQPEDEGGPSIQAEGVQSIILRQKGEIVCEVSAKRVTVAEDKKSLIAEDVQGGTLYHEAKPALKITARRVRFEQQSGDVKIFGGVNARGDNFNLQAPSAIWSHQKGNLTWPERSQATWRGVNFFAAGAFYDAQSKVLVCPQEVRASVPERVDLYAASARASAATRLVSLDGGVKMVFRPDANAPALSRVLGGHQR